MRLTLYHAGREFDSFIDAAKAAFDLYLECSSDNPEGDLKILGEDGMLYGVWYKTVYDAWKNHLEEWTGVKLDEDFGFVLTKKGDEFLKHKVEADVDWEQRKELFELFGKFLESGEENPVAIVIPKGMDTEIHFATDVFNFFKVI